MTTKKVTIIGNYGSEPEVSDGGRIKIRLYTRLLRKSGIDVSVVDLEGWKSRALRVLFRIRRAIKEKNVILIMAGPKGCRAIIPLVNKFNKKIKTRTVFCPLGIGTLDSLLKNLSQEQVAKFLNCECFYEIQDEKMGKELSKLDLIVPENERLVKVYMDYYGIQNVVLLPNYRDEEITAKVYSDDKKPLTILYASRICENKGIFDLMEAIGDLNASSRDIKLDIYGDIQLSSVERAKFNSLLTNSIEYRGVAKFSEMVDLMRKYDLFCLPTKYYGEGTSGSLIEAFISGTPALISSYSQASLLIKDGVDGYIFSIGNTADLKSKIMSIYFNKNELEKIGKAAQEKAKQYLFEYNRKTFFEAILGKE